MRIHWSVGILLLLVMVTVAGAAICPATFTLIPPPSGQYPLDTWTRIPNTAPMWNGLPNPFYPNVDGGGLHAAHSVVLAWSGAYFDPVRRELGISGDGHGDGSINGIWALNVDTWTWRTVVQASTQVVPRYQCADGVVVGPNVSCDDIHGGPPTANLDGSPVARHTYKALEYLPSVDRIRFGPGSDWWVGRKSILGWWAHPVTGQWQRKVDVPAWTLEWTTIAEWDAVKAELISHDGNYYVKAYHPATDTYRQIGYIHVGDNVFGSIDPTRRLLYVMGPHGVSTLHLETSVVATVTTTGATEILQQYQPAAFYAPELDAIVAWRGGRDVYFLDLATRVWTRRSLVGTPPTYTPQGVFGRMRPIGNGLAVVLGGDGTEDAFVFRYSGGGPVTPPPPLGTLIHDGPTTPEQISLYWPVTGSVSEMTGTVRFRIGAGAWTTAHPLYRIRPGFTSIPVDDAFAGVMTGLTPGTTYEVEATVGSTTQSVTVTTRALPAAAGAANKTISAGATSAQIQTVLDGLVPGDVLEFAAGTYVGTGNPLQFRRSGTAAQPITVRGASRSGVILRKTTDIVLQFAGASDVILESLTVEGSGVDSGTAATSVGVSFWNGAEHRRVTVRNITVQGVDQGIVGSGVLESLLVYHNTLSGNNPWTQAFLESNFTWNDDGIRVPGHGHAVFNNTLSGFGDSLAMDSAGHNAGIHFYRNDIRWTGDDAIEGDYGHRNITVYDNRVQNAMTLLSLDPLYGGPLYAFRNICINTGRSPFKFNSPNSGQFVYNNTIVRTNGFGSHAGWGWVQFNNGAQRSWAYRNNLLIYRGTGNLLAMESSGQSPIDFDHNGWFPNAQVWWTGSGGSFATMAAALAGLPATLPVFSGLTRRHTADKIVETDPFVTDLTLGANYLTLISTPATPVLSPATAPKNAGVAIAGITDGFTGAAPDMGAIIEGRAVPTYGD